jgi:hypothetical protein
MKQLLRECEQAKLLAISPRTLREWRTRRLVPFVKINRVILFDPETNKKIDPTVSAARNLSNYQECSELTEESLLRLEQGLWELSLEIVKLQSRIDTAISRPRLALNNNPRAYARLIVGRYAEGLLEPFQCAVCGIMALDPIGWNEHREPLCARCADPIIGVPLALNKQRPGRRRR